MEEDIVYVLLLSNNINGAGVEHDVMVFNDLESAQIKLEELRDKFLAEIANQIEDFVIEDDNLENYLASFSAYEIGYENEHYFDLQIFQRDVE